MPHPRIFLLPPPLFCRSRHPSLRPALVSPFGPRGTKRKGRKEFKGLRQVSVDNEHVLCISVGGAITSDDWRVLGRDGCCSEAAARFLHETLPLVRSKHSEWVDRLQPAGSQARGCSLIRPYIIIIHQSIDPSNSEPFARQKHIDNQPVATNHSVELIKQLSFAHAGVTASLHIPM